MPPNRPSGVACMRMAAALLLVVLLAPRPSSSIQSQTTIVEFGSSCARGPTKSYIDGGEIYLSPDFIDDSPFQGRNVQSLSWLSCDGLSIGGGIALTNDSELFVFGKDVINDYIYSPVQLNKTSTLLDGKTILDIAVGTQDATYQPNPFVYALTEDQSGQSEIYSFSFDRYIGLSSPQLFYSSPNKIKSIQCSRQVCMIQLQNNTVRIWGYDTVGNNALGNSSISGHQVVTTPTQVDDVSGDPAVISFAMGSYSTMLLLDDGTNLTTFGFGASAYQQTGCSQKFCLQNWSGKFTASIRKIAMGRGHTLFLDANGVVFGIGDNEFGQVAYEPTIEVRPDPTSVNLPFRAIDITCVHDSSFALLSTGLLYSWGRNSLAIQPASYGLLGHSHVSFVHYPVLVPLPYSQMTVRKLFGVSDGNNTPTVRLLVTRRSNTLPAPAAPLPVNVLIGLGSATYRGSSPNFSLSNRNVAMSTVQLPDLAWNKVISAGEATYVIDPNDGTLWSWGRTQDKYIRNNITFVDDAGDWLYTSSLLTLPVNSKSRGLANDKTSYQDISAGAFYVVYQPQTGFLEQISDRALLSSNLETFDVTGVQGLCSGANHNAFIKNGKLYTWMVGTADLAWDPAGFPLVIDALGNSSLPLTDVRPVDFFSSTQVLRVSLGLDFTIVETATSPYLWGFGANYYGQLANQSAIASQISPVNSTIPSSETIEKITSGTSHTLIITFDGEITRLYGFGRNNYGQLGVALTTLSWTAQVEFDFKGRLIDVSCVGDTSYVLVNTGIAYVFGFNGPSGMKFGGYPGLVSTYIPQIVQISSINDGRYKITKLMKSISSDIESSLYSYGPPIYMVAMRDTGLPQVTRRDPSLYGWGQNDPDRYEFTLGLPVPSYLVPEPLPVFPSSTIARSLNVIDLKFHSTETFALNSSGVLCRWKADFSNSILPFIEPQVIMTDVSSVATFATGFVALRPNGTLFYVSGSSFNPIAPFESNGTLVTQYDSTTIVNSPAEGVACSNSICAAWFASREALIWNDLSTQAIGYFSNTQYNVLQMAMMEGDNNPVAVFASLVPSTRAVEFYTVDVLANASHATPLSKSVLNVTFANQFIKIVAAPGHALVLKIDDDQSFFGSIYGIGDNTHSQLGPISTATYIYEPIMVYPSIFRGKVRDIGAIEASSVALMDDGTLYQWGLTKDFPMAYSFGSSNDPGLKSSGPTLVPLPSGKRVTRLFSNSVGESGVVKKRSSTDLMRSASNNWIPAFHQFAVLRDTPLLAPQCAGFPPILGIGFVCQNGIWTILGSVVTSNTAAFEIKSDTKIDGNFSVPVGSVVTFRITSGSKLPTINVTGCVEINGTVSISVDNEDDIDSLSSKQKTLLSSSCLKSTVSAVTVSTPKSCKKVTAEASSSDSSLNLLFKVDKSKCNTWWIVLVSVVGGVLLITGIVLLALLKSGKLRKKVQPYHGTN